MSRTLEDVIGNGAIRKYLQTEQDGNLVEITEWDTDQFKAHNQLLRTHNTRVDTGGCAWHQAASIPYPVIEQWWFAMRAKGIPEDEIRRKMNDPQFLLKMARDRDFNECLVSDKV